MDSPDGLSSPNGPVLNAQAEGETSFPAHRPVVQPMAKHRFRRIGLSHKCCSKVLVLPPILLDASLLDVLAKFVG